MSTRRPWKQHLVILIGYAAMAILLTWPTIGQFTTHVPGNGGDDPAIVWNLWWVKYSLLNDPQNPLYSNFMFYPIGINLAFYTLTLLNGLTSIPLQLNFGLITASNLHMWFTFTIGAYGSFLLVKYSLIPETKNHRPTPQSPRTPTPQPPDPPAPLLPYSPTPLHPYTLTPPLIAGFIYAFAASRLFYVALGQFNIASAHWVPFTILFFIKIYHDPPNLRWPIMAALFLTMQAWAELTYASFLIIFMALYWAYWLLADSTRRVIKWPYVRSALLLGLLFTLGISPYLAAILPDMLADGDFFVVGGGFADTFSSDVLGFFVPTMHHPYFGNLIQQTNIASIEFGQQIYIGYGLLALVAIGAVTHRHSVAARFWLFVSVVFALLMLGPEITVNGTSTGIPGPFAILQRLPIFNGNRYPSRFSVMFLLAMAPLAALGVSVIMYRFNTAFLRTVIIVSIALIILFENLLVPLPQSNMTVPAAYAQITQDDESFAVLDIPFGWRNGFRVTGAQTVGIMFGQLYQTAHQKPILHGNTSRNPELKFQYFSEAPVIDSLTILESGRALPAEMWQSDAPFVDDVLRFFSIKYIVVRSEEPSAIADPQATIPYIEAMLPVNKLAKTPELSLYQVDLPPWSTRVDLLADSPVSNLYFAEGWGIRSERIVAHREAVRLLVPLNGEAQSMKIEAHAPTSIETQMWLTMNGWQSTPITLTSQPQSTVIHIPAEAVTEGLNHIQLHFSAVTPVDPAGMAISVVSAGNDGGNIGHIYLNGVDVSPNQTGYNITVVDPDNGLIEAKHFDTFADPAASEALAQFITNAPDNAIFAISAKDTVSGDPEKHGATGNFSQAAIDAFRSIGGQADPRGQFRASHALIGGKNVAQPLEAFDALRRPVKLTTDLGLIEPNIAAVFESIVFETE